MDRVHDALNGVDGQIANRKVRFIVATEGTESERETICSSANDLQCDIRLMAVHSNKEAHVDLVLPDSQIGMVRVDLLLRDDLRMLRPVVGHRNEPGRNGFGQGFEEARLTDGSLI